MKGEYTVDNRSTWDSTQEYTTNTAWEYRVTQPPYYGTGSQDWLNNFGREGWELVQIYDGYHIFKRANGDFYRVKG